MLKKTAILASVIALAFVGLVGCSGGGENTNATPSPEMSAPATTESPAEATPAPEVSPS
ncbi:MAG: hypothetical protein ACM3YO_01790 [Bacteroidota bacterium]